MNKKNFLGSVCMAVAFAAVTTACGDGTTRSTGWEFSRNMYDPIAYNPDQPNNNFKNKQTAQIPPSGSMPIGFEKFADEYENTSQDYERAGQEVTNPLEVNEENLAAGQHLYLVNCAMCHGNEGKGDGAITKDRTVKDSRGTRQLENFPNPPAYGRSAGANSSRGELMADLSAIYYGVNTMGSHASQLNPEERWKVVMYVQELQKK